MASFELAFASHDDGDGDVTVALLLLLRVFVS